MDNEHAALDALLQSFRYAAPRPEISCRIGDIFVEQGKLNEAIFWYKTAAESQQESASGAFVRPEYQGYIPLLQLCVCYDRLGEHTIAKGYNDLAYALKPDSPQCKQNAAYFSKLLDEQR